MVVNDWGGGYVFSQVIPASAPRGVWRLELLADLDAPALTDTTFLVEDFLPERIDFDLALADDVIRLGDTPSLTVDARYLFGAPGADLAIEGETLLRAASVVAGWEGYSFGRHDEPFGAAMQGFDPARTDAAGQAIVPIVLPEVTDPARPLEARIAALEAAAGSKTA